MRILQKVWHWTLPDAVRGSIKFRALRGMAVFLALMVCCTLVARAADAVTVPVVETANARRMALGSEFSAQGLLEMTGGRPVLVAAGLPVLEMAVEKGDKVAAGDLLFTCDISKIEQEINAKHLDVAGIQAELKALEQNQNRAAEKEDIARQRAGEDLETAGDMADRRVREAENKLEDARQALLKYYGVRRSEYDESEYTQEEYDRLRSEHRAAALAVEQAEAERDNAVREATRKQEDVGGETDDATGERNRLSLQKLWLELAELNKIAAEKGAVYAPVDGTVRTLNVKVGGVTGSEAAALISDAQTLQFTASVTAEQRATLATGDLFTLALSGRKEKLREVAIKSIEADETQADQFLVRAELPAEMGEPGLGGTADFSNKSQIYDATVPLSALYGGENTYYVLTWKETQSILGTEYVAERVDVRLLERNSSDAAVTNIQREQQVITGAGRPVRAGDRIRLTP